MDAKAEAIIRSKLRGLEKKLVLERAELCVQEEVQKFLLEWELALCSGEHLPEPIQLIRTLLVKGFYLPGQTRAFGYLKDCESERKMPAEPQLLKILLF